MGKQSRKRNASRFGQQSQERKERLDKVQAARNLSRITSRVKLYDRIRSSSEYSADLGNAISILCPEFLQLSEEKYGTKAHSDAEWAAFWRQESIGFNLPFESMFLEFPLGDVNIGVQLGEREGELVAEIWLERDTRRYPTRVLVVSSHSPKDSDLGISGSRLITPMFFFSASINADGWDFRDVSQTKGQIDYREVIFQEIRKPRDFWWAIFDATMMVIQFLNCRNIVLIDHMPDPADSACYSAARGFPLTKYKTLAIRSLGERSTNGNGQHQFDVMPLHIRRGNFAHYSDDAPLFGKYTGTFWRPATVVGNEKNGIVAKDYKVNP